MMLTGLCQSHIIKYKVKYLRTPYLHFSVTEDYGNRDFSYLLPVQEVTTRGVAKMNHFSSG